MVVGDQLVDINVGADDAEDHLAGDEDVLFWPSL